jgi:hypothetical protein
MVKSWGLDPKGIFIQPTGFIRQRDLMWRSFMSDIIFEYTPRSIYSVQGSGPSAEEGYDIWYKVHDEWVFLGFCQLYDLENNMKFYQDQGDRVFITRSKNEI